MAVRYEGYSGEPQLEMNNNVNNGTAPYMGKMSVLLQWNAEDPVDDWEQNRNNIIYNDYQHNRNPFIDHPEYAEEIW
jgi:endonuclease I